jgi:hypothetical protein
LTNGGAGHNSNKHNVYGSAVTSGSVLLLKCIVTFRGDELHALLVKDGIPTCKVGFAAKQHREKSAAELDGMLLRVKNVNSQDTIDVGNLHRMYRNYGSAQAVVISETDALSEPAN